MNPYLFHTLECVAGWCFVSAMGWLWMTGRIDSSRAADLLSPLAKVVWRLIGWPLMMTAVPLGASLAQLVFLSFGVDLALPARSVDFPLGSFVLCWVIGAGFSYGIAMMIFKADARLTRAVRRWVRRFVRTEEGVPLSVNDIGTVA